MLSGIVGDLWAGSVQLAPPRSPRDLENYGLTRGLNVPREALVITKHQGNAEAEFEQVRAQLSEPLHQITYLIRNKMLLLSYLVDIPRMLGAVASGPFLSEKVAMSFATIDANSRKNRKWQYEYLAKVGFESVGAELGNRDFTMDYGELERHPLKPLDVAPLSRFVKPEYITWVNRKVQGLSLRDQMWLKMREKQRILPPIGNKLRSNSTMDAYAAYMCMKPIELLLRIAEGNESSEDL